MTTKKYETVLIEKQDGITWLVMNRPDKRNAMSPQLHLDMDDALEELAVDPGTEVVVLTGAGEAFCAGQDIKLYFRGGDADPVLRRKASRASSAPSGAILTARPPIAASSARSSLALVAHALSDHQPSRGRNPRSSAS